jgi:hypothetical protein
MAEPDIVERLRDCTPTRGLFTEAADEIDQLRTVFRAAVEFHRCFHDGTLSEEIDARKALLDAVTTALDGERRG